MAPESREKSDNLSNFNRLKEAYSRAHQLFPSLSTYKVNDGALRLSLLCRDRLRVGLQRDPTRSVTQQFLHHLHVCMVGA